MRIELHIPGLLAVPARLVDALPQPEAPALQAWCREARAERVPPGRYGYLAHCLHTNHAPLAELAWLGAHGKLPERQTFLATPVHLQPGLDDLVLFAGPNLGVTDEERAAIAQAVATHFGDAPLIRHVGDQLFLQAPEPLDVQTTPLHLSQGCRVRDNLPKGSNAGRLHAWLNEVQMLLHGHEINRRRADRGQPALNSLWIWGEGELPSRCPHDEALLVHARSPLMRGMAHAIGAKFHEEVVPIDTIPRQGAHCIAIEDCLDAIDADDVDGWRAVVERVSRDWLVPVMQRASKGVVSEAILYGGDGRALHWSGRNLFRKVIDRLVKAPPVTFGRES